jgi:Ni/Co efflux regulator RcnB
MKKLLVAFITAAFALALTAKADDATDKTKPTKEQKAERKALIEKYDANKDGKIDKEERAKMTKEDSDKWKSLGHGKKKDKKAAEAN